MLQISVSALQSWIQKLIDLTFKYVGVYIGLELGRLVFYGGENVMSYNSIWNRMFVLLLSKCGSLAVSPYDSKHGASHLQLEHEKERNLRMANLIGFGLHSELESRDVTTISNPVFLKAQGALRRNGPLGPSQIRDLYWNMILSTN
ncbi:eukaryotic translation initiation factor 3 subunit A [Cucumis melo var. makuwa]|uniref:Eukaryotic translation initiation factor 3 subunit A n=1 Tax=Cucumis melo var. makuwa TaxID=1194695 RepID=A0A5D3CKC0_CUCMM|nr:eukaryotic translation initiation factor 3 subunit A [Cucumis melo var. makuwa]TYK12377.1 eukaryotic translation initiation factor 3 subunit A [Cucumis melo var. makuwa]